MMTNLIAAAGTLGTKIMNTGIPVVLSTGGGGAGGTAVDGINSIKDIIKDVVVAAGAVLALFGVVQIGVSISQHDSQQRINGFLFLAGGIIVAFAPTILQSIGIAV